MPTDLPERKKPVMSQRARDFYCGLVLGIIGTISIMVLITILSVLELKLQ